MFTRRRVEPGATGSASLGLGAEPPVCGPEE